MDATDRPAEATTKKPRVRRYKRRDKKEVKPIKMTPRVIAILELLKEHRFLTTTQISQVHESQAGSPKTTGRLLRRMYDAGLVDKPEEQLVYRPGQGSEATIYGLGDHGAAYLSERYKLPLSKARMRDKNHDVSAIHIEHTLLSAEVSLAYERACRQSGLARLIGPLEILERAPAEVRETFKPFRWPVKPTWDGKPLRYTIEPDRLFGLELLHRDERVKAWFVREDDNGTETIMPLDPFNLKKTNTLFHKFLAYFYTHQQKLLRERFNVGNFRVLTTTTKTGTMTRTNPQTGQRETITRMQSMQEVAMRVCNGTAPGLFLFAEREKIVSHSNVLTMPWQNAKGELVQLVRSPTNTV